MLDNLKSALKKAQERLEDAVDYLEDGVEDLSEESAELWQKLKPRLESVKVSVAQGVEALKTQSEDAHLQAHLATMDAKDQWESLNKTVAEFSRHTAEKGRYEIQHAELQAHLAAMEARDFINEHGPALRREFAEKREKAEELGVHAAKELEKSLEKLGDIWARTRH